MARTQFNPFDALAAFIKALPALPPLPKFPGLPKPTELSAPQGSQPQNGRSILGMKSKYGRWKHGKKNKRIGVL